MNTPIRISLSPEKTFQRCFLACLLVADGIAFAIAAEDKSWRAFGIMFIYGPIMNGIFLLAGALSAIPLKRKNKKMSLPLYLTIVIVGPLIATVALGGAIYSLGLHGC
jgi:hypothetical protein